MKKGYLVLCVALIAAGCVTQPSESELRPTVNTTGSDSGERERARIHTELASGYFELGNYGVALEEVRIALQADSNFGPAYNVAGLVYAALKEDRRAEQNFERALSINPLDSDAHNNYGRFLCQTKREDEGIKHFMAAVRNPLYKSPERSFINAGICSRQRGDNSAAVDYFQQAIKRAPNEPRALYQLADLAYGQGDYAAAKRYLDRLAKVVPPVPELLWLAVRVERKLGNSNAEASYAQQLRKNFPDSKESAALAAGQYE
jgi:type IV pilus assembly protein PilF